MMLKNIKYKIIKLLFFDGNKLIAEKILLSYFKKLNKNSKKLIKNIIQLLINQSSFIFKLNNKIMKFKNYFFIKKTRIYFSIKQIIKFNFSTDKIKLNLLLEKQFSLAFTNKKLLYYYRWNLNQKI